MSERLELLRPILDQYKRRFTVLDLGAGIEGYQNIGAEIAREYDAVCVMVERDWVREKFIESRRTVVLKHDIGLEDLTNLAACEHFDVVLALNFLHWAPFSEWGGWLDAVVNLGEKIIIQVPSMNEALESDKLPGLSFLPQLLDLLSKSTKILGATRQFPEHRLRHLLYLERNTMSRKLTKTHLDAHQDSSRTEVYADNRQVIAYHKGQWQKWIPGVNLYNAMKLGMVWPQQKKLAELMRNYKLPLTNHGDVTLHNFVFDGEELHLVDGFEGWEFDDKEGLRKVIEQVEMA